MSTRDNRPLWHRNELGIYEQPSSPVELQLPPDLTYVTQDASGFPPIFENRFYAQQGSTLWFMVDPTINPLEDIKVPPEVTNRDRASRGFNLREALKERDRENEEATRAALFGLIVNPRSISISLAKSFSTAFARAGWTVSHNYTEYPTITMVGSTGAFYFQVRLGEVEGPGGITRGWRDWSGAYQNLLDMVGFFKQNATVRKGDDRGTIRRVMEVVLLYEGWTFVGSFQTLTINESAEKPFVLDYNIQFEAHEMWHSTWPQSTKVVLDARTPDDLRRTETPEMIIKAGPLEREEESSMLLDRNEAQVQRLVFGDLLFSGGIGRLSLQDDGLGPIMLPSSFFARPAIAPFADQRPGGIRSRDPSLPSPWVEDITNFPS